jgi:hypothetical protein
MPSGTRELQSDQHENLPASERAGAHIEIRPQSRGHVPGGVRLPADLFEPPQRVSVGYAAGHSALPQRIR